MSVKTVFQQFTGFVMHYAGELTGVVTAIRTIVNSLPIDAHDKQNVSNILDDLSESVTNIHNALAGMETPPDVVIKKSDLIEAVKEFLESDEGKAMLGNGNV